MDTISLRSAFKVAFFGTAVLITLSTSRNVFADAVPRPSPGGEMIQMLQDKDKVQLQKEIKVPPVIEQETKKPARVEGASDKKMLVKRFEVRGNTLLDSNILKSVTGPAEGKELTIDDIWNVADLITSKYREAGYILANASVPSQTINEGAVVIMVVEGRIATISVSGNKSYSSSFIERNLANALNDSSVKEDTLERDLLILNDYQSLSVKASLKAGKDPGTTDLVVGVTDKFPISGSISYDNFGLNTTSKDRINIALNMGNLLTSGDLLMLRGTTGLDKIDVTKMSYGRAEYLVPVGGYGTEIGGYFSNSIYNAGETLTPLNLNGRAIVTGLYVIHPFLKKRDETLSVRVGGEYLNASQDLMDAPNTKDNIRKIVVNVPYTMTDRFLGRNYLAIGYSVGLGGALNGTKTDSAGSRPTRPNASDSFGKLSGDIMRIQKLPGYNHLIIRGSGQYTPDNMLLEEQFIIGGEGTVRGFNPAQAAGDSGYYVSAELALSPFFADTTIFKQKVGDTIKFALFADHGGVINNQPQTAERKSQYLTSVGCGVRLYGGQFFTFKLDNATPRVNGTFKVSNSKTTVEVALSF